MPATMFTLKVLCILGFSGPLACDGYGLNRGSSWSSATRCRRMSRQPISLCGNASLYHHDKRRKFLTGLLMNSDGGKKSDDNYPTQEDKESSEYGLSGAVTPRAAGASAIPERDPGSKLPGSRRDPVLVGDPQKKVEKEMSVNTILEELAKIQEQGPQKYCVLGTRHCSYLHQRIIELLYVPDLPSDIQFCTEYGAFQSYSSTLNPNLFAVVLGRMPWCCRGITYTPRGQEARMQQLFAAH
jgi:hypothetical protein